jgi:hypothetical protein
MTASKKHASCSFSRQSVDKLPPAFANKENNGGCFVRRVVHSTPVSKAASGYSLNGGINGDEDSLLSQRADQVLGAMKHMVEHADALARTPTKFSC